MSEKNVGVVNFVVESGDIEGFKKDLDKGHLEIRGVALNQMNGKLYLLTSVGNAVSLERFIEDHPNYNTPNHKTDA